MAVVAAEITTTTQLLAQSSWCAVAGRCCAYQCTPQMHQRHHWINKKEQKIRVKQDSLRLLIVPFVIFVQNKPRRCVCVWRSKLVGAFIIKVYIYQITFLFWTYQASDQSSIIFISLHYCWWWFGIAQQFQKKSKCITFTLGNNTRARVITYDFKRQYGN